MNKAKEAICFEEGVAYVGHQVFDDEEAEYLSIQMMKESEIRICGFTVGFAVHCYAG